MNTSKAPLIASLLSSAAMFSLAAALTYFAFTLWQVTRDVPAILATVEEVNQQITPVVDEVGEIRKLIPPILEEVAATREAIPPILDEVAATRKAIPPVLREYARTNDQIPGILAEVAASRKALPPVLNTVDGAVAATNRVVDEVAATRPLVTKVLAEVKATRDAIPPILDHADRLVASAREAGREASRGAVSGVFSGIIMAPFVFVGNVGKRMLGLSGADAAKISDEDYKLIEAATSNLLEGGKKGDVKSWVNSAAGTSGQIRLVDIYDDFDTENECRRLEIMVKFKDEVLQDKNVDLCQNDEGEWDFKK